MQRWRICEHLGLCNVWSFPCALLTWSMSNGHVCMYLSDARCRITDRSIFCSLVCRTRLPTCSVCSIGTARGTSIRTTGSSSWRDGTSEYQLTGTWDTAFSIRFISKYVCYCILLLPIFELSSRPMVFFCGSPISGTPILSYSYLRTIYIYTIYMQSRMHRILKYKQLTAYTYALARLTCQLRSVYLITSIFGNVNIFGIFCNILQC